MRKFDTNVQYIKYRVLTEIARAAFEDRLAEHIFNIPKIISPGPEPTLRCCIYKERAIAAERVKLALGGSGSNPNVIEVLDIACDECPASGYEVTESCRGCIAHRCRDICPRGAITADEHQHAHIDKSKCINCGLCARVCPYSAIINRRRPCENACKLGAISPGENGSAHIDYSKCVSCGACVYQCPFGAISDKSFIVKAIDMLKASAAGAGFNVYAVVAPAISGQFTYARLGQVVTGLHQLGFYKVIEAALGADFVAARESLELMEKGFLFSSCCPAFVELVRKRFPEYAGSISTSLSPMAMISSIIKQRHPNAKVIFIGPCTAKKKDAGTPEIKQYVDCVLTFEELQALFDARDIDLTALEDTELDHASSFGRRFAKCGGLAQAVAEGLKEHGCEEFDYTPVSCDGIEECISALKKVAAGKADGNFIEGMACTGGCIGGAGCLTHAEKNKIFIEKYGLAASSKRISQAVEAASSGGLD